MPRPSCEVSASFLRPDVLGHDPQFLERFDVVDEAAREPAHDVVRHRFGERDLRVLRHALRVEAHVGELPHEVFERHPVLQAEGDRGGEGVEQPAHRRALLADVGEEDLADRAVGVLAGGDVALVPGDVELVGDRFALLRHPLADRFGDRDLGVPRPLPFCASVRSAWAVFEPSR